MKKKLTQITKILKSQKSFLKRQFDITSLGIFGSYARGTEHKRSDVDILVEFRRTPGFFDYLRMENLLSQLLGKPVDLVMKDSLKANIGKRILNEVVYI